MSTITTRWTRNGSAIANHTLDYFVFSGTDGLVTYGTGTTNSAGYLVVNVPNDYAGIALQIFVNDLDDDMNTTGKIHGQQVVTAV